DQYVLAHRHFGERDDAAVVRRELVRRQLIALLARIPRPVGDRERGFVDEPAVARRVGATRLAKLRLDDALARKTEVGDRGLAVERDAHAATRDLIAKGVVSERNARYRPEIEVGSHGNVLDLAHADTATCFEFDGRIARLEDVVERGGDEPSGGVEET